MLKSLRSTSGGTSSLKLEIGVGSLAPIFASKPDTVLSSNTGVPEEQSEAAVNIPAPAPPWSESSAPDVVKPASLMIGEPS